MTIEEALKAKYRYNPFTGELVTRKTGHVISCRSSSKHRRTKYVNAKITFEGKQRDFRVHNIAWLFMTGEWPTEGLIVDHIDGEGLNNKWENLQLLTQSENIKKGWRDKRKRLAQQQLELDLAA